MLLHHLKTHDPFFNLALEEVLFSQGREQHILLYINDPAVVIGKHQSPHKESDTRFVTQNGIPVIRRISGGGTVFHDSGNLNFTFIRNSDEGKQVDFRKYTQPVIDFLRSHGINASFEGKNDIRVDGLKVSGNAEHVFRNRVLHHGTLLFNSSLDLLRGSIRNDKSHYLTKAVNSNPASVMNLGDKMSSFSNINDLTEEMIKFFTSTLPGTGIRGISEQDEEIARKLADSKYRSWEWNFAYGPEYDFINSFIYKGNKITCRLNIADGIVRNSRLEGSDEMKAISGKLNGCRHTVNDFREFFRKEKLPLSENEIFNFF